MKTKLFLLAALGLTLFSTGCGGGVFCNRAEGPDVTETITLPDITGVVLAIPGKVTLRQGEAQSITATGPQNYLDLLETKVRNGVWEIEFSECTRGSDQVSIDITMKTLESVGIAGSGDIETDGSFTDLDEVEVSIAGSGNITVDVEANTVRSNIAGSGNIDLGGTAPKAIHKISGSGNIQAYDMESEDVDATISGSGSMWIRASKTIDVTISGSGDVYYRGTPLISTNISGSGNVINDN